MLPQGGVVASPQDGQVEVVQPADVLVRAVGRVGGTRALVEAAQSAALEVSEGEAVSEIREGAAVA